MQAEVARTAMALFDRGGFEATTVGQIAAAAGISQRSFFRYFPTKEDVVLDDPEDFGQHLQSVLRGRPTGESAWQALNKTLRERTARWQADAPGARQTLRLLEESPTLRARLAERSVQWQRLLLPDLANRMPVEDNACDWDGLRQLRAAALVGAAFSCLDAAFLAWRGDDALRLDELLDQAMSAVRDLS